MVAAMLLCGCIAVEKQYTETGETVLPPQEVPPEETGEPSGEAEGATGEGEEAGETEETPGEPSGGEGEAAEPSEEPEENGELMGEEHLTVEKTEVGEGETEKEYSGMRFDGYTLLLEDLTDDYPQPCASLRIVRISGTEITEYGQMKICPGESQYWTSPEDKEYRIKVFDTAAGYSEGVAWADIAIYGQ